VYQHLTVPDRDAAILSVYVINPEIAAKELGLEYPPSAEQLDQFNQNRHQKLKQELTKDRTGFIEFKSGYGYNGGTSIASEKSLLIPNISKEQALQIARNYNQESILWKDNTGFYLLGAAQGNVWQQFYKNKLNFIDMTDGFSALVKANSSQKGRKFSFLTDVGAPSVRESLLALDMGIIPKIRHKRIY
jgi:hypothetical protein